MKSNLPLWEQIARNFIEEIQRGVHPLGSLLPTELEVAERFDVSRHTVRTAYAELVRLGYVRRTPRVGTQVINTEQLPNFYYEVESFSNLDPYHNLPPREVLAEADFRYDVDSDTTLPFAEGTQVWRLDFARFGKLPYEVLSFTTAWMPASSKVFRKELFEEPSVPLINQLCRLRADVCQTIDQSVHARLLSAELAHKLRTRPGGPILEIQRTFRNPKGEVLLHSRNYFKGNDFSLDIRLSRRPFV